jgi:Spy/CpxP family protein refolding chaperone
VKRTAAIASILAIFALGVAVGGLGMHLFYVHQFRHTGALSALGTRWIAADLSRQLDLTDAQKTQIDAILEDSRREARQIRAKVMPGISELMARTHARIAQVLTPEQRAKFEQYHHDRHDRIRRLIAAGR